MRAARPRHRPTPSAGPARVSRSGALAVGAVLLLSGCVAGSRTTTSTMGAATSAPSTTATATLPTDGASLAGSTPDPNAQPVPSGEGVPGDQFAQTIKDLVAAKGTVRMTMATPAGAAKAQVDTRTKAVRVEVDAAGRAVTLVHLGDRTWVRGAGTVEVPVPAPTPGTRSQRDVRRWLLLDPGGADAISAKLGAQAKVAQTVDPARFTAMLNGLLGDRTPRGDGAQVAFTVPPAQYLDAVSAPAALRGAVTKPVRLVVALDATGAPTSVTATVPTKKSDLVDRTEYARWGEPVTIEAPPADDVAPAPGSQRPTPTSTSTSTATAPPR
ncbi:hypothetical protein GGG17_00185 [Arsenicicoccus sp. MKL-02]|uniref:LppX_LprAFG lipoprotein n=1 Tax=Arsenicicoccus cauae TaxID=2663847 RepID=A0A6I3IKB9_9MICO|nr:hypothetical protein [Arsenicicoccus cauae]MTB70420.1 hypothetical protein [Arsenicicoccus cauae]